MKAVSLSCVLLLCAGAAQSQSIILEYADPLGNGTATTGPAQIEINLLIDFPVGSPSNGGAVNISYDSVRTSLNHVEPVLPPCPAGQNPCIVPGSGSDDGAGVISGTTIEAPAGLSGMHLVATLVFNALNTGTAEFGVDENTTAPFGVAVTFTETQVDIIDPQTCTSGSLPQNFQSFSPTGLPDNWASIDVQGPTNGPVGGFGWQTTGVDPNFCDFDGVPGGDNVTGGLGDAACLQQTFRGVVGSGPALCTTSPLDLTSAVNPVLELHANFQPEKGIGATFKVVGGLLPPDPVSISAYDVLFETDAPLGAFASLPGETLVIPLPSVAPYHVCVIVNGFAVYAQVDHCISCALSCGGVPDSDGDGVADNADNCLDVANADQRDTNDDGYGNVCDPDVNNDCNVNFLDLEIMRANFFQNGDLDTDFNGDGSTNFLDLALVRALFFGEPGPSGLLTACNAPQRALRAPDCAGESPF